MVNNRQILKRPEFELVYEPDPRPAFPEQFSGVRSRVHRAIKKSRALSCSELRLDLPIFNQSLIPPRLSVRI